MSFRTRRVSVLVVLAAAACAAGGASAAPQSNTPHTTSSHTTSSHTTTYRWVDDQGVIHYGDQIPPEYANKERVVLNGQGVPVGHLDAQKSPAQLATEARDRASVMRQKQHDAFLVTTYTSAKDIEALRDSRLEQLTTQRTAAQQYVESLRSRLGTLQARALSCHPYSSRADARRMPDDLAENLVLTLDELRTQSAALASQGEEEAKLRAQFQADIERYNELHTLHSSN